MKVIKPEELEIELAKMMQEYEKEVNAVTSKSLQEGAENLVKTIKQTAPRSDRKSKGGPLADSFVVKQKPLLTGGVPDRYVYSPKKYRLVHLLEFGTIKMPAQPFLEPGFMAVSEPMYQKLLDRIKKIK